MDQVPSRRIVSTTKKRISILLGSLLVVALCIAGRHYWPAEPANADTPNRSPVRNPGTTNRTTAARPPSPATRPSSGDADASDRTIVATVNTQRITREELAGQCRRTYGVEVLESLVNKRLIIEECKRLGISVTRDNVNAEIQRMAKRFSIPVDQLMKMIQQKRNITPEQYADDIIWPMLALRKIAGEQLIIGHDELVKEFEIQYGDAIRARLIAVSSLKKAKKIQAQAVADPEDFGNLAKDYSEDAPSASAKGVINPIRKHGSYREIEDAVFNMADGEVSPVIHAGGQYVILQRVGLLPARQVSFEQVAPKLEEVLRDRKMRSVSKDIFRELQENTKVVNVWNDPVKRQQMPGVAATINRARVTIRELDQQCVARHGRETLEGMINRKILEQECRRRNITVSKADLDAEIARAALVNVRPKPDGSPDVEAWLELVTEKQDVPLETYRQDVVWPTVALKMLVGDKVEVTDEDLQKGYDANYGPRVRCLAIVLNNQRRAQQVFELARKNNTPEYFGELATQYSVEPGSQAMNGEVPPIKKYGGQPLLEEEAFQLKPGEISGVIQVGDKFIILRCEEYIAPAKVDFDMVRDEIHQDLLEKKARLAMATEFERLQSAATVDNYLAGSSRSPKQQRAGTLLEANVPSLRQVPGK